MKLSVNTGIYLGFLNEEEALISIKKAGFDAYDCSFCDCDSTYPIYQDDYIEHYKKLRKFADELGLVCNQTHSPFPTYRVGNEEYNEHIKMMLIRSIEVTKILGAEICIVHPWNDFSPEQNAELVYLPLVETLKKHGVKAAVENMWNFSLGNDHVVPAACSTADNFIAHMKLLPKEHFVACLDLGHASLFGDTAKMIKDLGPYIKALHVHDTDLRRDLHTVPYFGNMNWDSICLALKQINYSGDFSFEVGSVMRRLPTAKLKQSCLNLMHDIGRELIKKIEE